jgi:hypothetical protein
MSLVRGAKDKPAIKDFPFPSNDKSTFQTTDPLRI